MKLIELFLPLYDNDKKALEPQLFTTTYDELIEQFGGLTTHARTPTQGFWQKDRKKIVSDELIIFEVMTARYSRPWWNNYKLNLEKRFMQEQLIIRVSSITLI